MLACFCKWISVCAKRLFMSKTVAPATISTQCGFTNGAGWTVTIVHPYSIQEAQNMLACFCKWISVCAKRLFMSKTVAPATISTQCGFTNGAGWTVTIVHPYSIQEAQNMLACFCKWISVCAKRLFMSKTVAPATISTQCGFTNGAGWTVTIVQPYRYPLLPHFRSTLPWQTAFACGIVIWQMIFRRYYYEHYPTI